jgi:hypothetical protein
MLRCEKKESERQLREMSEIVIAGSFEIWRKHVQRIHTKREELRPEIEEMIESESRHTNEGTAEEAEGAEEAIDERIEEIEMIEGIEGIGGIEESEAGEFVETIEADDEVEMEADGDADENEHKHEHDEEEMGPSGERAE